MKAHKGEGDVLKCQPGAKTEKVNLVVHRSLSRDVELSIFFLILDNQVMALRMQKADTKKMVHFNIFYVNALFIHSTKLDEGDFASQYLINPIISPAMKPGSICSLQMNSVGL